MITFENVSKSYKGLNVLKNININIAKEETLAIIGPSGCGKSTFLKCINGLVPVNKGKIFVDGLDVTSKEVDLNKIRSEIGIVFQQFLPVVKPTLEHAAGEAVIVAVHSPAQGRRRQIKYFAYFE